MSNYLRNGSNTNQFGVLAELDSVYEEELQLQSRSSAKSEGEGTKLKVVTSLEESLPKCAAKANIAIEDDVTGERRSRPFVSELQIKDLTPEEDSKPPRSDRDVIEEALRIHDKLVVLLRSNSTDGKLQEVFQSKIKLLESEVEGYNTCPDSLLSGMIAAIEARIRKFKSLSMTRLISDGRNGAKEKVEETGENSVIEDKPISDCISSVNVDLNEPLIGEKGS
ncbi:hypothetical protein U1Q18_005256 [Sarracenia purpurea var. burkii]